MALADRTLGGRRDTDKRLRAGVLALLGLSLILAACSGGSGSTAQTGGGTPTAAAGEPVPSAAGGGSGASAAAGGGGAGGANGFEGSLASSGLYAANWTVAPDVEANPINGYNNPTLTSDKGTGAKVTLDATGAFVCAFTIDSDLKGLHDGAILHMSGGLTDHWHPEGVGDLSCP